MKKFAGNFSSPTGIGMGTAREMLDCFINPSIIYLWTFIVLTAVGCRSIAGPQITNDCFRLAKTLCLNNLFHELIFATCTLSEQEVFSKYFIPK